MKKVKAFAHRAAALLLSPEALALEKPLLRKLLFRYGISAAAVGAALVEIGQKLAG